MSLPVPDQEPTELVAGDTLTFLKALADFPAGDGWSLEYELSGPVNYDFTSEASGNSHQLTVAAAITAEWLPGDYELAGYAVNADERKEIYRGRLKVRPDTAAGAQAERSFARQMVEKCEAVMLKKAGHDIEESDVEGTRMKRLTPEALRKEWSFWKNVVAGEEATERAKLGLPNKNVIHAQFQITGGNVPIARTGWPWQ